MKKLVVLMVAFGFSHALWAAENCVKVGEKLPSVTLDGKAGKLFYDDRKKKVKYAKWSPSDLKGKVYVVYHLAARQGIDKINQPFVDAQSKLDVMEGKYGMLTILNIDDVFFGGSRFARSSFESSYVEYIDDEVASFVLDDSSALKKTWCLKKKSSTLIVLDSEGVVLGFKDGQLSTQEVTEFIELITSSALSMEVQSIESKS